MILLHGINSLNEHKISTQLVFSTDFSNAYVDGEYLHGTSNEGLNYSIRYATLDDGKALISNNGNDKFYPFAFSLNIYQLLNPKICVKYSYEYGGGYVYAWISPNTWGNDMFELGPAFGNVCMIKNVDTNFYTPNQSVTSNLRYRLTSFTDNQHQVNEYAIKRNDSENKNEFYINDTLVFDCVKSDFNMNNFFGLQSDIKCKIWEIKIYADV